MPNTKKAPKHQSAWQKMKDKAAKGVNYTLYTTHLTRNGRKILDMIYHKLRIDWEMGSGDTMYAPVKGRILERGLRLVAAQLGIDVSDIGKRGLDEK
jgi:hypothetical protein